MGNLNFTIRGDEPPFNAYLLTGSSIINSFSGMTASGATGFTNVGNAPSYIIRVEDGILHVVESGYTPTTTTTTTTTTTLPPTTTTTTTTLPPTTTTTTTTLPPTPKPKLFMSVFGFPPDTPSETNYNSGDLTDNTTYQVMYSTNSSNTQGTGPQLTEDVDVEVIFDINNLDAQFTMGNHADASAINTSTLPVQGTNISTFSFTFTLDSAITTGRGWFTFDITNPTINPDDYTIRFNISDQAYDFGIDTDSTDPIYVPSGVAGTDWGYSGLASNVGIDIYGEVTP